MCYNIIMNLKKTIAEAVLTQQIISKSKFLSYLAPVSDEDEAKEYLRMIKKEHPKATHHCSAFIVGDIERSNDDGEPASSAGLPMLQVLRGSDLDNVIAVVVRYYGGTKLGVGGLIRAYGSSVTMSIEEAKILEPKWVYTVALTFPYDMINPIETLAEGVSEIIDREYTDNVTYILQLENIEDLDALSDVTKGTGVMEIISKEINYV